MSMRPVSFPQPAPRTGRRFSVLVIAVRLLDVISWCVALVGAGAALMMAVLLVTNWRAQVQLPVAVAVRGASAGTASLATGTGTLSVQASPGVAAAVLVVLLGVAALLLLTLRQLRALIADIDAGTPFGARSARRVQLIGAAVVAVDVGRALVVLLGSLWAGANVHLPGVTFVVTFPLEITPLGAGLLLIALGEVFRRGWALQRDQDLTI